jgi:3'-phosphoadenosine 5'-phosphosulfate sulfotransferase (PAPS reductase)/FAD synthetase
MLMPIAAQSEMFAAEVPVRSLSLDPLIEAAARAGAWFVFSLSGGKDCGAVSALAMAWLDSIGHPRAKRYAMHADLGRAEWPFNTEQVVAQAAALGLPLKIEANNSGDLVRRFENRWELGLALYANMEGYNLRGPFSTPDLKFCQSEQKIQVLGPAVKRAHPGETIVQVTGLRREESIARRSTVIAKPDNRFVEVGSRAYKAGTRMLVWNPGVLLLKDDVFAINAEFSIPLSPAYGLGASRHSCRFCIMASADDLEVAARYPDNLEMYRHYVGIEVSTTFSFQGGRWLGDVAPDLLTPELTADLARAKRLNAERRALEAGMPPQHRYQNGWPLHVPTEAEAQVILDARRIILSHHGVTSPYDSVAAIIARFTELKATGQTKRKAKAA